MDLTCHHRGPVDGGDRLLDDENLIDLPPKIHLLLKPAAVYARVSTHQFCYSVHLKYFCRIVAENILLCVTNPRANRVGVSNADIEEVAV